MPAGTSENIRFQQRVLYQRTVFTFFIENRDLLAVQQAEGQGHWPLATRVSFIPPDHKNVYASWKWNGDPLPITTHPSKCQAHQHTEQWMSQSVIVTVQILRA